MRKFLFAALPLLLLAACPICPEDKEPIVSYEILFSPQDHVADELISLINKEKKSVKAAVFCLMHRGIAKAMIDAHNRGVAIEIIVDPFSVKNHSPLAKMAAANLPIYVWYPPPSAKPRKAGKNKNRKPLMHDKFCVLGNKRVWTGSFNFTFEAATRNRENVIVLENESVAGLYLEEFERLKEEGCMVYAEYMAQKNR